MLSRRLSGLLSGVLLLTAACTGTAQPDPEAEANLLQEIAGQATRTPTLSLPGNSELLSPLEAVTLTIDQPLALVVTPTPPPSKTPTEAITLTLTPSQTFTPINIPPLILSPTAPVFGATSTPINSGPGIATLPPCRIPWIFNKVRPPGCPGTTGSSGMGVYQSFEKEGVYSYMIWVEATRDIFVLYGDGEMPGWRRFDDTYRGPGYDPECEAGLDISPYRPSLNHYQPCRGFGKVWRNKANDPWWRIGWSDMEREQAYTIHIQYGPDGTMYFDDLYEHVHALTLDNRWIMFANPNPIPVPLETLP